MGRYEKRARDIVQPETRREFRIWKKEVKEMGPFPADMLIPDYPVQDIHSEELLFMLMQHPNWDKMLIKVLKHAQKIGWFEEPERNLKGTRC